eukprot:2566685-Amphidinium_carterae.1
MSLGFRSLDGMVDGASKKSRGSSIQLSSFCLTGLCTLPCSGVPKFVLLSWAKCTLRAWKTTAAINAHGPEVVGSKWRLSKSDGSCT